MQDSKTEFSNKLEILKKTQAKNKKEFYKTIPH